MESAITLIEGETGLPSKPQLVAQRVPIRGTQSFLLTIAKVWKRPSLLGLELLWRWGFGIPALVLIGWEAYKILSSVSLAGTHFAQFSLIDSEAAVQILSSVAGILLPPILAVIPWLLPVLALGWALASGLGRSLVLRKYDPALRSAPWSMVALQLLRIVLVSALGGLVFAPGPIGGPGDLFHQSRCPFPGHLLRVGSFQLGLYDRTDPFVAGKHRDHCESA